MGNGARNRVKHFSALLESNAMNVKMLSKMKFG
jgi:hypothetical protein